MSAKLTARQRLNLIKRALNGENKHKLCKEANISRTLLYRWIKRFQAQQGRLSSLKPKLVRENNYRVSSENTEIILKLVKTNPSWSVAKIASSLPQKDGKSLVGHHGVQNTLQRLNLNTLERRTKYAKGEVKVSLNKPVTQSQMPEPLNALEVPEIRPQDRLEMIERVKLGEQVNKVCSLYGVSRTIFYRWLKRYEAAPEGKKLEALWDQKPKVERYYKQASQEYEEAVLSAVREYPELSSHRLVWVLPQIGGRPILGNHGVQNVLRRNNLSTFEQRLLFSRAYYKPTHASRFMGVFTSALSFLTSQESARRKVIVVGGLTASLSVFFGVVVYGVIGLGRLFATSPSIAFSIGTIFGLISLSFGMIFFIYSLKYYFTIAAILSFSRNSSKEQEQKRYIQNNLTTNKLEYQGKAGLKADLTSIILDRKPFVSIHLPTYNEKKVLDRLLTATTSMDYENYEVILADDSTDPEVLEILKKWHDHPRVKILHRESRSGYKGGALQYALSKTDPRSEFVIILDADFIPYPDTIQQFLKYFKASTGSLDKKSFQNTNIAAVQGYQWHVLNKSENWITRGVRTEYAGSYVIERTGIELYSGLKQISGSVYMIRADVLKQLGWGTSITEDFELTLRLYAQGYKVVYTPYIQAPAEAVSTVKRLIRQRMRWAEGHSHNIKKMFWRMLISSNLTKKEKGEFVYLAPYYLQSFFFIFGTFSWFLSEVIFQAQLPFWTSTWGWSLVFTNFFALPLMNIVGLFMEESTEKDYLGIFSFVAISYIVAPFQGYAAVKGLLEKEEGPWFRTPKTGKITDVFTPAKFYKFVFGIFGKGAPIAAHNLTNRFLGINHVQRLSDGYEEDGDYQEYATPQSAVGSLRFILFKLLNWFKGRLGLGTSIDPHLAFSSAYNTFSNIRPPRARKNTLVGKIILTVFMVLTFGINQITFMTQYEIDWKNFNIKARTSYPLLAQGGREGDGSGNQIQAAGNPTIEQQINIINQEFSSTSTTDVPTDNSLGIVRYTSGSYDPAPTVYFEAILRNSNSGTTTATLYDAPAAGTGAVAVYNSAVSVTSQTYTRVRSDAITLVTGTDYTVRVNASSGTAYIIAARIIAAQSTTTYVANTETQIELGANETTTSTSTSNILSNPKIWQYTSGNYDGTVTIYFEATIKSSDTATSQASLYDKTSGALVASSTLTSDTTTNWQRVRSGAITLTSGDEFEVAFNKVTSGTASIANAKVIITQTSAGGLEASELYHDYITYSNSQIVGTLSTFATTSQAQLKTMLHVHQSETATIGSSSYIYLIGGQNTVGTQIDYSTVYKSTLNGITGDAGTFSTASQGQLPLLRTELSTTKATIGSSTYIYVLGGSAGGAEVTTVYKTTLDSGTGDLSAFATTSQSQLPELSTLAMAVTASIGPSSYIYSIGGCTSTCSNNNSRSTVYKATINSSGDISTAFSSASQAQLPLKIQKGAAVKADIGGSSYMYVLGGVMNTTVWSAVYKGTINATTGDLASISTTSQAQLPDKFQRHSASIASIGPSTYLYVAGGTSSTVYRATINTSSGDVGSFSTTNQSQIPIAQSDFSQNFATINGSSYLYMMGGVDTTAGKINQSTVYKAPLSDDYNKFRFDNLYDPSKWVGGTFTYYHEGVMRQFNINHSVVTDAVARITPSTLGNIATTSNDWDDAGIFRTTNQAQLPVLRDRSSVISSVVGSSTYVYVVGGTTTSSTVYKSTVNNTTGDLGTFATASQAQLLRPNQDLGTVNPAVGASTYVYVVGGYDGTNPYSTVYKATLNSTTGDIGAFASTSQKQLPVLLRSPSVVGQVLSGSTYLYVIGGNPGSVVSTVYKTTLNSAVDSTNGDITNAFDTTSQGQLPGVNQQNSAVTATLSGTTYLYVLGGDDGSVRVSTVYKAQLTDSNGNIGAFSTSSQAQLPVILRTQSLIKATVGSSTYFYVLGGCNAATCGRTSTVYRSTLNTTTGDVGFFSTTGQNQLPVVLQQHVAISTTMSGTNYLYVLGGDDGASVSTVYKSLLLGNSFERYRSSSFDPFLPNNTNTQTFTTTNQAQFTQLKQQTPGVIHTIGSSSYLYVLGGIFHSTVYKGILNSNTYDLEALNTTNQSQLPQKFGSSGSVKATIGSSSYIYVIGGQTDSTPTLISTVYKATINGNSGDIGTFDTTSQAQFPNFVRYIWNQTKVLTVGSSTYIYVLGGQDGVNSFSTVYKATLSGTTGDVGTFDTASQAQLPANFSLNTAEFATVGSSTYLYFMGGSSRSTLYKSTLNPTTGDVGSFNTSSQSQLPEKLGQLSSQIVNTGTSTYLYVLGGTTGTLQSTVYKATLNGLTGNVEAFSTTSQAQLASSDVNFTNPSITSGNSTYVYLIGGTSGMQSSIYKTALPTFRNQAGEVGSFATTSQAQLLARHDRHISVTGVIGSSTYIYVLGGGNATSGSTVYRSNLSNITGDTGTLSTTAQGQLPAFNQWFTGNSVKIGTSTYVYVLGGSSATNTVVSSVYKAKIDSQAGNLGAFSTTAQAQLPSNLYWNYSTYASDAASTYLYLIGGCVDYDCTTVNSTVYRSTIKDDSGTGDAGTFDTTSQAQLPQLHRRGVSLTQTVGSSTYIYLLGGLVSGTIQSTVYKSTLGGVTGNLGAFATTSQGQLPINVQLPTGTQYNIGPSTYVYIIGGDLGASKASTVYKAPLGQATGDVGTFDTASQGQIPVRLDLLTSNIATIGPSTYLYLIGGRNDTPVSVSTVYKATLSSTSGDVGSLSTTSQAQLPLIRRAHGSEIVTVGSSSYLYVIAGIQTASTSTIYKSTLNGITGDVGAFSTTSQAQVAAKIISEIDPVVSTVGPSTYIYVVGGVSGAASTVVYKGTINSTTGDVSTFNTTSQTQLPEGTREANTALATVGSSTYLYTIGIYDGTTTFSTVYRSTLNGSMVEGDLDTFATTSQAQLPATTAGQSGASITISGSSYIYSIGGATTAAGSTVYKSTVNATTGDLGAFATTSQGQIPVLIDSHSAFAATVGSSSYIYVAGGNTGSTNYSTVYRATINSTTGNAGYFSTTYQGQIPGHRFYLSTANATVGSSTYMYVIGGRHADNPESTVYKSALTADGNNLDTEVQNAQVSASWLVINVTALQIPENLLALLPLGLVLPHLVKRYKAWRARRRLKI